MKILIRLTAVAALMLLGPMAQADVIVLGADRQCSEETATNEIEISDVSGASDCFGTFGAKDDNTTEGVDESESGNDPGPGGSFQIGDFLYDYYAKDEQTDPDIPDGFGLDAWTNALSGDWSWTDGALGGDPFLIVLKAANAPGYGVWLFSGDAESSGTWSVAWGNALSHFSVYVCSPQSEGCGTPPPPPPPPPHSVPEPGTLALLGLGLIGMGAARRRKVA